MLGECRLYEDELKDQAAVLDGLPALPNSTGQDAPRRTNLDRWITLAFQEDATGLESALWPFLSAMGMAKAALRERARDNLARALMPDFGLRSD